MENEKLRIKKGASLKEIMIIMICIVGAFGLFFMFIADQASNSNIQIDQRFNTTYTKLQEQQGQISNLTKDIRNAANSTTEAKIGDYAFFGLRGILTIMKAPLVLMNIGTTMFDLIFTDIGFIPEGIKTMISFSLLVIIIFTIIKFLTSRGNDA